MSKEGFEAFWKIQVRKVGKFAAQKSYERALQYISEDELLTEAIRHNKACAGKSEEFVPHPSTWLNQGRWMDEAYSAPSMGMRPAPSFPREPTPEEWRSHARFQRDPNRPGGHANVWVPATNKLYAVLCERAKTEHVREYLIEEHGIWVCGYMLR